MASLHKSTIWARKLVLVILLFFILVLLFNLFLNLRTQQNPIVVESTQSYFLDQNNLFGSINTPNFSKITYNTDAKFELDRRHSQNFPNTAYVYKVLKPRSRVLDLSDLEKVVTSLGGFISNYNKDGSIVTWNNQSLTRSFIADLESRTWEYKTKYLEDEVAKSRKNLLTAKERGDKALESEYEKLSRQILGRIGVSSRFGFSEAAVHAEIIERGLDGFFVDVDNPDNAEYVHLSFSRNIPLINLKKRPDWPGKTPPQEPKLSRVYSDDPRYGQLEIIVSNQLKDYSKDVFEFNFIDFEYNSSLDQRGVYLIINPDEAWSKIQKGEGGSYLYKGL